jgi:hypothetical protein
MRSLFALLIGCAGCRSAAPVTFVVSPAELSQKLGQPPLLRGHLRGRLTNVSGRPLEVIARERDHVTVRSVVCNGWLIRPVKATAEYVGSPERPRETSTLAPGAEVEFPVSLRPMQYESDTKVFQELYAPNGRGHCSVRFHYEMRGPDGQGWRARSNKVVFRIE